ncbi:PEP-CTERM sorting domain-containing protein [Novosphingobium nitrogenifigens]|nr:PEP-CTERM sorting domain-containing protein [Novosphingobium nitrogenifigens]
MPEPSMVILFGLGAAALVARQRWGKRGALPSA